MVCSVHRKCRTRAGISWDVNKTLRCVAITDGKFSKSYGMNDAKERIHKWGNNMTWTIGFFASICANENFQTSILPTAFCLLNCFLNILIISTVLSHDMSKVTKLLDKAKFLISEPDFYWVPTPWLFWRDSKHTVFVVWYTMSWGKGNAPHTSKSGWRAVTMVTSNTTSST